MKIKTSERKRKIKLIRITCCQVDKMCRQLANKIKKDKIEFDGIYAIPRGGLIPGVYLSHLLTLPLLTCPTNNTLLVDEISDNGGTSHFLKRKKFACLYSTTWTTSKPDYYCRLKKKKSEWLIFPWEVYE